MYPHSVEKLLRNLRPDKAVGDDELSPRLLAAISKELSSPVASVFRKSLDTGIVPRDWRTANITPLFKKGHRSSVINYRPVSLTSQIVKVMETLLRDAIVQHLDKHGLIRDSQHGFRKGRSCATNLLSFLEFVTENVNNQINVDVIFLDLAKAFDKVPHQRLLLKLSAHGIDGVIKDWISAWLSDRWQRVCIDGMASRWRKVTSGVPQGSVLGPVLFFIFINDLEDAVSSEVWKFADDTKMCRAVSCYDDCSKLQDDLNKVSAWAEKWQMDFNASKCKVIHFGKKHDDFSQFSYSMKGFQIESVDSEKDL